MHKNRWVSKLEDEQEGRRFTNEEDSVGIAGYLRAHPLNGSAYDDERG